jgi:hypothetical protein
MTRKPTSDVAVGAMLFEERHFSPIELSRRWGYSAATVRRLIADEQGVLRLQGLGPTAGKRPYTTYSVPESVAARIYQRLSDKPLQVALPRRNPRRVVFLRDSNRRVS